MALNPKNGRIEMDGTRMEYIRFGSGKRTLVMLPGLGDSLRSVYGAALPMALMYQKFTRDFTVYAFSRKWDIPMGYTTRDMARDQAAAMERLGIEKADVLGVSMGGMVAQWLAIDYPERVNRLILTVTCPGQNPILRESVNEWISLAKAGDHSAFMDSNLKRIYSDGYYRRNRWTVPILGALTKPESYDRFFVQADACLTHDATDYLGKISAPTLVVGGEQDRSLGGDASRELAAGIPGAQLRMYEQWGHGLYEEAKDFNQVVMDYLHV